MPNSLAFGSTTLYVSRFSLVRAIKLLIPCHATAIPSYKQNLRTSMTSFWDHASTVQSRSEADVEKNVVFPLLLELGYRSDEIRPKQRVIFQEGRKGRPHEADFVVYHDAECTKDNALLVVEAKAPTERIGDAKEQAESYAQNLRAPFFVITNGLELGVWQLQISGTSNLILQCALAQLLTHRHLLESCISRDAAINYSRSLIRSEATSVAADTTMYVRSELDRCAQAISAIARTLNHENTIVRKPIESEKLLQSFPKGALIFAPSGFGKSTLAKQLLHGVLRQRVAHPPGRLACEIFLPDIASSREAISFFAYKRIAAWCPAYSSEKFRRLLRDEGIVLVCDGFDRLDSEAKPTVEADLRMFQRDHPLAQIFVLSRPSLAPDIDLPHLTLLGLDKEQQRSLFRIEYTGEASADRALYQLPHSLKTLLFHPLLLSLIARYSVNRVAATRQITEIFENWINRILTSGKDTTGDRLTVRYALTLLANATVTRPLEINEVVELFMRNRLPELTVNRLLNSDAVSQSASTLELSHEALADYLRAIHYLSSPEAFASYIAEPSRPRDSLLPVLAIALANNREQQQALWTKALSTSLHSYLEALRFRADASRETVSDDIQLTAAHYLDEILRGVEDPLSKHFPQMHDAVATQLSGDLRGNICIMGNFDKDNSLVSYCFHRDEQTTESANRVTIGERNSTHRTWHRLNLKLNRLRNDSGRLVGTQILKQTLHLVVATRRLTGLRLWTEERLQSRIRLLEKNVWGTPPRDYPLDEIESELAKVSDHHIVTPSRYKVPVQEMLDDIQVLKGYKLTTLTRWWLPHVSRHSLRPETNTQWRTVLDEHFRRTLLLYKELCESNLKPFVSDLSYAIAPARWIIQITSGRFGQYMHFDWKPVADWSDIGADVVFSEKPKKQPISEKELAVVQKLRSLGRRTQGQMFTFGFSPPPEFDGTKSFGGFDGETSALRDACEMIDDDIRYIFGELPTEDSQEDMSPRHGL